MEIEKKPLKDLRIVAAPVMALAVLELCPDARLVGGGSTSSGFYYDFMICEGWPSSFTKDIEERMYAIAAKKSRIHYLEMIPVCAEGCLKAQGERFLAEIVGKSNKETIFLLELFGKRFPVEAITPYESTEDLSAIKILKIETKQGYARIHGTVFLAKDELKKFLKENRGWIGKPHREEKELFLEISPGRVVFLPKGKELLFALQSKIEKNLLDLGALIHVTAAERCVEKEHAFVFEATGSKIVGEFSLGDLQGEQTPFAGVFSSSSGLMHIAHLFASEQLLVEEAISCLHFMTKIFKILGFELKPTLLGKKGKGFAVLQKALDSVTECFGWNVEEYLGETKIEWRMEDYMGKMWPIAFLSAPRKMKNKRGFFAFSFSVVTSMERLLALAIEEEK